MIRRPPRSTHCISSAASDVYKRQIPGNVFYLCMRKHFIIFIIYMSLREQKLCQKIVIPYKLDFIPGRHFSLCSIKPFSHLHLPFRQFPTFFVPVHSKSFTQDLTRDRVPIIICLQIFIMFLNLYVSIMPAMIKTI